MLLAGLVEMREAVLGRLPPVFPGDGPARAGQFAGPFQHAERASRVSVGASGDPVQHTRADVIPGPSQSPLAILQRAPQNVRQLLGREWLQDKDRGPRQQRADHLEARILGGRADQEDHPFLDKGEKCVLLRLVEAVNLVAEEDRSAAGRGDALPGLRYDRADARHPLRHSRERDEGGIAAAGQEPRQRGLAAAGRAPQDQARKSAPFEHSPERAAVLQKTRLSRELGEGARAHAGRERGPRSGAGCPPWTRIAAGRTRSSRSTGADPGSDIAEERGLVHADLSGVPDACARPSM